MWEEAPLYVAAGDYKLSVFQGWERSLHVCHNYIMQILNINFGKFKKQTELCLLSKE